MFITRGIFWGNKLQRLDSGLVGRIELRFATKKGVHKYLTNKYYLFNQNDPRLIRVLHLKSIYFSYCSLQS